MTTTKAQFWGYTLNNHTSQEMVLVRDPPASVGIVHHVFTPEEGESGTPHIQGYVKLGSQVRKSHLIKRWLERASFRPLSSDEYRSAMLHYVQKQDATARGATTQAHTPAAPVLYPGMMPELIVRWIHDHSEEHFDDLEHPLDTAHWRRWFRNERHTAEQFDQWLDRQTDKTDRYVWRHFSQETRHHGDDLEHVTIWCGREFNPASEAPWLLLIEFAKSQLVRQYQCEALLMKAEVTSAVRRYAQEILWRIEHSSDANPQNPSSPEEDDRSEASGPRAAGAGPPVTAPEPDDG